MPRSRAFAHSAARRDASRTNGSAYSVEDRLARFDGRPQRLTLVELMALLVHREVEISHKLRNLVAVVLQTDRKGAPMGFVGDEAGEGELIRCAQVKTPNLSQNPIARQANPSRARKQAVIPQPLPDGRGSDWVLG
jgi:hypothetical protein